VNLAEVLLNQRITALEAEEARDHREAQQFAKTAMQSKDAGVADWGKKLWGLVSAPFRPSAMAKSRKMTAEQALHDIELLRQGRPKPPMEPTREAMGKYYQDLHAHLTKPRTQVVKETVKGEHLVEGKLVPYERVTSKQVPMKPKGLEEAQMISELQKHLPDQKRLPWQAVLGVTGALGLTIGGVEAFTNMAQKANLKDIMKDPEIPMSLRPRARDAYTLLARYAPTISKDKTFSRDFTKNLIRHEHIDHKIVTDLINAEKVFNESKQKKVDRPNRGRGAP